MNAFVGTKKVAFLIAGDFVAYFFSLVIALAIRYGEMPNSQSLSIHLASFLILFAFFLLINFIVGLYEKQAGLIRTKVTGQLVQSQIIGVILGVMFFYFAPVTIAPKANLFIYFAVSTVLIFLWRNVMYPVMYRVKRQNAILVGEGKDIEDLYNEINSGARYNLVLKELIKPTNNADEMVRVIHGAINTHQSTVIIADFRNHNIDRSMSEFYALIFSGVQVIDASRFYEGVFDRVPLSMVGERWLVENASTSLGNRRIYDAVKRTTDVVVSVIIGTVSLIIYPFVYLAIWYEDRGPLFIKQERVGKNKKHISIIKFRSMSGNDGGNYTNGTSQFKVTKVGKVIRKTRIDELPQLWNVIKGDLSLIGPRPELPTLVDTYDKEIPFYNARHLVKPGLSGWAQIYHEAHPHHEVATEDTRDKLSYDLFYIKNRSFAIDLKIALRTIQTLINVVGR